MHRRVAAEKGEEDWRGGRIASGVIQVGEVHLHEPSGVTHSTTLPACLPASQRTCHLPARPSVRPSLCVSVRTFLSLVLSSLSSPRGKLCDVISEWTGVDADGGF